jgi:hypothetical protein
MTESWRPIPGLTGHEVSDLGRVRSVDRTIIRMCKCGPVRARLKGRVLAVSTANSGYLVAMIGRARPYIHSLVLEVFIGPRPAGHQAAHNDGDRLNNTVANLRWATRQENEADKLRHGRAMFGANSPNRRKTHCSRGHPYDEKNTRRTNGKRQCRTCGRDHQRRRRLQEGLRLMSEGVPTIRAAQIAKVGRNTLGSAWHSGAR